MKRTAPYLRRILALFHAFVFVLALAAAIPLPALGTGEAPETSDSQPGPSSGREIVLTDAHGHTFTLDAPPRRIASSALMTDEILFDLLAGGPEQPIDEDQIAKEAGRTVLTAREDHGLVQLTALSSMASDPHLSNLADRLPEGLPGITLEAEGIIALDPDLLFTAAWADADTVEQLRRAGIPVYQTPVPSSLPEIRRLITRLSQITGLSRGGRAIEDWLDRHNEALAQLRSRIPEGEEKVVMEYTTWGTAGGRGSSWNRIVELAGCRNGAAPFESDRYGSVTVSRELLVEVDPEILVTPAWVYQKPEAPAEFRRSLITDPALQGLKAVRREAVIQIPEPHKSASSHYMILGARDLARAAYPERADRLGL